MAHPQYTNYSQHPHQPIPYAADPYAGPAGYQQPTAYADNYGDFGNPYAAHSSPYAENNGYAAPQSYAQPQQHFQNPQPYVHVEPPQAPYAQSAGRERSGSRGAQQPNSPSYPPRGSSDRARSNTLGATAARPPMIQIPTNVSQYQQDPYAYPVPGGAPGYYGNEYPPPRPGTAPGSRAPPQQPLLRRELSDPSGRSYQDDAQGYGAEVPNYGNASRKPTAQHSGALSPAMHASIEGNGLSVPSSLKAPSYVDDRVLSYYASETPLKANHYPQNDYETGYVPDMQAQNGYPPQDYGASQPGAYREAPRDPYARQPPAGYRGGPRGRARGGPPGMDPRRPPPGDPRDPRRAPPNFRGRGGYPPPGTRSDRAGRRPGPDGRDPRDPRKGPSDRSRSGQDGRRQNERSDRDRRGPPGALALNDPRSQDPRSQDPRRPGTAPDAARTPTNGGFPPRGASSQTRSESTPPDPDKLPHMPEPAVLSSKPLPYRPGLQNNGQQGPGKPLAPVRQYTNASQAPSDRRSSKPITQDELNQIRNALKTNPNDPTTQLKLAQALVDAAKYLSDDHGRADAQTKARNRDRCTQEAHKIVQKLASENFPAAQFYLADCMSSGALGIPNDPKEAFILYQNAAKGGHPQGAYRTAVCCEIGPEEGGGTRKDYNKAFQWYKRAASLGDAPAMFKLGMINLHGYIEQPKNPNDGVMWLKRAAECANADDPHALHELGLLYEAPAYPPIGGGITHNPGQAFSLFEQSANWGYKHSQYKLGAAYEYGQLGCTVDARNSIIWYTKAAAQGQHDAELALSGWYLTGSTGILEHSDTEAYLWARKAASAEPPLPKALFALGYFTEVGIGCQRSLEEAKRWYGRAAAYKFPKAQERLEELKRGGASAQKNRERLSRSNPKQVEKDCVVM